MHYHYQMLSKNRGQGNQNVEMVKNNFFLVNDHILDFY